jgi:hypothetical protein
MTANADPASFRRGDWVEVRSFEEIAASLDDEGTLDGMPFMPEMMPYCGRRFRVYRRADKTCVEGLGMRRLQSAVFLEGLRCDGSAHEGCQRGCVFFWKEAWLQAVSASEAKSRFREEVANEGTVRETLRHASSASARLFHIDGASTSATAVAPDALKTKRNGAFFCQSTELQAATSDLPGGKLALLAHDYVSGDSSTMEVIYFCWRMVKTKFRNIMGRHHPGQQTADAADEDLNLQPGEWVEVKSTKEIVATLDANGKNRGMTFEEEMLEHCGRRYRVAGPINRIILEEVDKKKSKQMVTLKNTVALEGVVCRGLCAKNCPRANFFYWRELWLRRVK